MDKEELIIRAGKQILKFRVFKEVTKSGSSGGISLPKSLIGKIVKVEYGFENGNNKKLEKSLTEKEWLRNWATERAEIQAELSKLKNKKKKRKEIQNENNHFQTGVSQR